MRVVEFFKIVDTANHDCSSVPVVTETQLSPNTDIAGREGVEPPTV